MSTDAGTGEKDYLPCPRFWITPTHIFFLFAIVYALLLVIVRIRDHSRFVLIIGHAIIIGVFFLMVLYVDMRSRKRRTALFGNREELPFQEWYERFCSPDLPPDEVRRILEEIAAAIGGVAPTTLRPSDSLQRELKVFETEAGQMREEILDRLDDLVRERRRMNFSAIPDWCTVEEMIRGTIEMLHPE